MRDTTLQVSRDRLQDVIHYCLLVGSWLWLVLSIHCRQSQGRNDYRKAFVDSSLLVEFFYI